MAALQAANPGRVVSAPAAMVNECVECLEEMATADVQASRCRLDRGEPRWGTGVTGPLQYRHMLCGMGGG